MTKNTFSKEVLDHVTRVQKQAAKDIREKYLKGQIEHGGCLWEKPVAREIRDEALDLMVYTTTLLDQLKEMRELVDDIEDIVRTRPAGAVKLILDRCALLKKFL